MSRPGVAALRLSSIIHRETHRAADACPASLTRRIRIVPRKKPSKAVQDYLWSESAGYCQNPECANDLHAISDVPIAERAHIIAASPDGPRGADDGGTLSDLERAEADNLLLLCPTCHTKIDKSPKLYDVTMLREWKKRSQDARETAFGSPVFLRREEALAQVRPLFASNKRVFELYGPTDDIRDTDRADRWSDLVRTTIIPNNTTILRIFHANSHLLTHAELAVVAEFEIHEAQLRDRHLVGNWAAQTVRFPEHIRDVFEEQS
jgi:hypothetical protein